MAQNPNPTTPLIATPAALSRHDLPKKFPSGQPPARAAPTPTKPPDAPAPTTAMAPSKTKTVKNKFAGPKRSATDGVAKKKAGGKAPAKEVVKSSVRGPTDKKKKKKTYTEEELGIPKLNSIRPADVVKPKGQKKGKVFVDDTVCPSRMALWPTTLPSQVRSSAEEPDANSGPLQESMRTILAIVQAEKEGQIESKMIKARQMEEIREARRAEAEKKEQEKKDKLEGVKDSIRKKRKKGKGGAGAEEADEKEMTTAGTKAAKPKKKKAVSFA